jgi:hypothetical protein
VSAKAGVAASVMPWKEIPNRPLIIIHAATQRNLRKKVFIAA